MKIIRRSAEKRHYAHCTAVPFHRRPIRMVRPGLTFAIALTLAVACEDVQTRPDASSGGGGNLRPSQTGGGGAGDGGSSGGAGDGGSAGGTDANGPCVAAEDCLSDLCVNGECVPHKQNGETCVDGPECYSGHCADGVCCNTPCDGLCEGCSALLTMNSDGECSPFALGEDPELECRPPEYCQGDSSCGTCGQDDPPTGGTCNYAVCNGGCTDNICHISCSDPQECQWLTFNCPNGFACELECLSSQSCSNTTLNCPPDHECTVSCNSGSSCNDLNMNCSANGSCSLGCNANQACVGAAMSCGANSCVAACLGSELPALSCGNACDCDGC